MKKPSQAPGVSLAYSGVHQAYQMALAAQEAGLLHRFYCSLYSDGFKIGGWVRRLTGRNLDSRRLDGLDLSKVVENPWPLVCKAVQSALRPSTSEAWFATNEKFDRWSANRLLREPSNVVVTTETCGLFSLRAARSLGAIGIHDCPQIHPHALQELMQEAAERSRMAWLPPSDEPAMEARKLEEYSLADHLLVYSDFHRQTFTQRGFPEDKLFQCPLWVDPSFWKAPKDVPRPRSGPLRVLFVGSLTLRKGLPFLLKAFEQCRGFATLTLAGPVLPESQPMLKGLPPDTTVTGPLSKQALREQYYRHDLLVLPSIADSFGFVALEAMACGLPVLVSENCGAPVPAEWRIPAMNTAVLGERLTNLASDEDQWKEDQRRAVSFARQFSPARYRAKIGGLLQNLTGRWP